MNELTIIKKNGGAYIDSRDVAVFIGKRHDHLLRDIGNYLDIIEDFTAPNFGGCDFFVESSYLDVKGRARLCYLITKMGCEMVANKLTGEKGVIFTYTYVRKFNDLEQRERGHRQPPRLSEFNSAVKNVLNGMSQCYTAPDSVMKFLRGVYEPLGIEVLPFHETDYSGYYTVTEIAAKVGVYSAAGRPHGHAVSAIISKLENHARHAMVIPYGLVGATFRYDSFIVEAVRNWLADNKYPNLIHYLDFDYHIYYRHQFYRQLSLFDDDYILDLSDDYTEDELDEMCSVYDDCDVCPGRHVCCDDE